MPRRITIIDDDGRPETAAGYYGHDVDRLHRALGDYGYLADSDQARRLWELYSDSTVHGWADMNKWTDAQLVERVRPFFTCGR